MKIIRITSYYNPKKATALFLSQVHITPMPGLIHISVLSPLFLWFPFNDYVSDGKLQA